MKLLESKTTTAIAVLLIVTIAVTLVALPIANAHYPAWTVPTWCYCAVTNSVIGVNQVEVIIFWVNAVPPTAQGAYGDRWTFWVDIITPGGSNETLGPFTSDPVGGGWTTYTPTQVGNYTVVARMDAHKITGLPDLTPSVISGPAYVNDTYLASSSAPVEVIAQQEPIQPWPEAPLPTLFWTRPINDANREWAPLAGNWLAGAAQNVGPTILFGYGTAPESAHVMWATPMWAGGIMDARFGDTGYQTSHYEGLFFTPPIILNGKIYYNVQSYPREGWYCLDLYTGETLYFHNTTGSVTGAGVGFSSGGAISGEALSFGQIYNYESPNQHGGFPYLWSTSGPGGAWMMFDAFSGNYMCSIANVSSAGTAVYGKDGSILRYNIVNLGNTTNPKRYLQVWNTSQAIWWKRTFSSNSYWMWRPGLNVTYDGRNGFSLNASIPDVQGSIRAVREDQFVIGGTAGSNNEQGIVQGNIWALNLKPDNNGIVTPTLLWNRTFTPPSSAGNLSVVMSFVDPEDGVFLFWNRQLMKWYGYSLETGQQLWTSEPEIAWSFYNMGSSGCIYKGMLLSFGDGLAAGEFRAYNITTGEILWKYEPAQVGFESPYGNYPISITCIADGKVYLVSGEHSPTQPLWRGSYLRCVNASNGAELWKVLHWGAVTNTFPGQGVVFVADGFLVGLNLYDNQIYCYGKGPSATTVEAPMTAITAGDSVVIRGTVTDQCVGAKEIAEKVGFTNGVPAVSDASQEAWMEWLYAQEGKPTNATGVEVSLDAFDPNGNLVHIGTVTSDTRGTFGYAWTTPDVPGTYQIIATFAGSAAYYGSYAETYAVVTEAPPATAPPEYPQPIDPTMTIVYAAIAIIIAVVLVGIWMKRK
jgi:hypothetical protein